jgi:hypothetical protein
VDLKLFPDFLVMRLQCPWMYSGLSLQLSGKLKFSPVQFVDQSS